MSMVEVLISSGEAARRLDLPRWKLQYLIEKGDLPGPTHLVAGRRLFNSEDWERLELAWGERKHRDEQASAIVGAV